MHGSHELALKSSSHAIRESSTRFGHFRARSYVYKNFEHPIINLQHRFVAWIRQFVQLCITYDHTLGAIISESLLATVFHPVTRASGTCGVLEGASSSPAAFVLSLSAFSLWIFGILQYESSIHQFFYDFFILSFL